MFEFLIAKRYIRPKKGNIFKSLITIFSIGGVAIGVAALLIVLSVMNGFKKDLMNKILGVNAHLMLLKFYNEPIERPDTLISQLTSKMPELKGASPFIYTKMLIKHNSYVDGIVVRGIDQSTLPIVSNIGSKITLGKFNVKNKGIVLGVDLADKLRAHIGDTITLSTPFGGTKAPFGYIPHLQDFILNGIYDAGMYEYNSGLAYISIKDAQKFLGMKGVTGIEFTVNDIYKVREIGKKIILTVGYPFRTTNWIELNHSLFSALQLEKETMFIILVLIIIVAAFNIISILIMIVLEKTREIGILKAIGVNNKRIKKIFMIEGTLVGFIGTSIGVFLGYILSFLLKKYQFISLPSDVYFIDKLPVHMQISDFVIVAFSAIIISFLATLYPASKAANLDPVEAIRYE